MSNGSDNIWEAAEPPVSKLSDTDIFLLNTARAILAESAKVAYDGRPSEVRCAVQAETAGDAIFTFLSWTHAYLGRSMTHEQLHMTSPPAPVDDAEPEPQSLRVAP